MADVENSENKATLTIRLIRSFPYKNIKLLILKEIDLNSTFKDLYSIVSQKIATDPQYKQLQSIELNRFKIYSQPFCSKTCNYVINIDDEEKDTRLVIQADSDAALKEHGVQHETEISLFNFNDYNEFKRDPTLKW